MMVPVQPDVMVPVQPDAMVPVQPDAMVPVQLVSTGEDGELTVCVASLEQLLQTADVKDRRLVVLSVVGAFRKGKSFLLNFLLNYLRAEGAEGWLENGVLEGFSWRAGSERDTTGILVWPQPFLVGQDLAVLLVDTQGMFDDQTDLKQNTLIFALSTLMSSVQVFNVSQQIQMNDMHYLQLFLEYGRLVADESDLRPFQHLLFLIRDWQNCHEFSFGFDGGQQDLEKKWLNIAHSSAEKQSVIETLTSCFSKIRCFLMPHPGKVVARGNTFKGSIQDIDPEFVEYLKVLVKGLVSPKHLVAKTVGGVDLLAGDFPAFVSRVFDCLQKDGMPDTKALLSCMADSANRRSLSLAKDQYATLMSEKCGHQAVRDIETLHEEANNKAVHTFDSSTKFGGEALARPFREHLLKDLAARFEEYKQVNAERLRVQQGEALQAKAAELREWYYGDMSARCAGRDPVSDLEVVHASLRHQAMTSLRDLEGCGEYQDLVDEACQALAANIERQFEIMNAANEEKKKQQREERLREQCESHENKWRVSAMEQQQHMFERLGDRHYDFLQIDDKNQILERKVGFAKFGPPEMEHGIGYSDDKMKVINKMSARIRNKAREISTDNGIYFAVLYVHYIDLNFKNPRIAQIFKIGKSISSLDCVFIDFISTNNGRVYKTWDDFLNSNKFPKCWYTFPHEGFYHGDDNGIVQTKYEQSPACGIRRFIATTLNVTSGLTALGSLGVAAAVAASLPVAAPLAAGAVYAGYGSTVYCCGQGIATLVDRYMHDQSVAPTDIESGCAWISIVTTPLSFVSSLRLLIAADFIDETSMFAKILAEIDEVAEIVTLLQAKSLTFLLDLIVLFKDTRVGEMTSLTIQILRALILFYFNTYIEEGDAAVAIFNGLGEHLIQLLRQRGQRIAQNLLQEAQHSETIVLLMRICSSLPELLETFGQRGFPILAANCAAM